MQRPVTPIEARAALDTIERGRLRVIDEIDLPNWYWWGLALGWIAIGFVTDLEHPWLTAAATLTFGAVHAAVAPRVMSGRHRSGRLSVSAAVAGPRTARLVIGGLVILAALTVVGALAARADGARHPVTMAGIVVAVMIVLGGPQLLATVRRRAARAAASS
jgi:4-hydroxybenzoate polyprenyltransferase